MARPADTVGRGWYKVPCTRTQKPHRPFFLCFPAGLLAWQRLSSKLCVGMYPYRSIPSTSRTGVDPISDSRLEQMFEDSHLHCSRSAYHAAVLVDWGHSMYFIAGRTADGNLQQWPLHVLIGSLSGTLLLLLRPRHIGSYPPPPTQMHILLQ